MQQSAGAAGGHLAQHQQQRQLNQLLTHNRNQNQNQNHSNSNSRSHSQADLRLDHSIAKLALAGERLEQAGGWRRDSGRQMSCLLQQAGNTMRDNYAKLGTAQTRTQTSPQQARDSSMPHVDLHSRIKLLQSKLHPGAALGDATCDGQQQQPNNSTDAKIQKQQQMMMRQTGVGRYANGSAMQTSTASSEALRPRSSQSDGSDSSRRRSEDDEEEEEDEDEEEMDIARSGSPMLQLQLDSLSLGDDDDDRSSNSSMAPTPPPRLSSLQSARRPLPATSDNREIESEEQVANNHKDNQVMPTTTTMMMKMGSHQQQQRPRENHRPPTCLQAQLQQHANQLQLTQSTANLGQSINAGLMLAHAREPMMRSQVKPLPPTSDEVGWLAGSRTPITKAVQELVEKQQLQQQATFHVINTPASRQPIRPAMPSSQVMPVTRQPLTHHHSRWHPDSQKNKHISGHQPALGSLASSASMSSLSSAASSSHGSTRSSTSRISTNSQFSLALRRPPIEPPVPHYTFANQLPSTTVATSHYQTAAAQTQEAKNMLIYLFFIFTCGWCVCWLIFLNYQQHSRLSSEQVARRRRLRRRHQLNLCESSAPEFQVQQPVLLNSDHSNRMELVVNEGGHHQVLARGNLNRHISESLYGLVGLEEDEWDLFGSQEDLSLFSTAPSLPSSPLCSACPQPPPQTATTANTARIEMRGWPEHLIDANLQQSAHQDEDQDETVLSWPLVALHENPLNGLSSSSLTILKPEVANRLDISSNLNSDRDLDLDLAHRSDTSQHRLERSRLLSLHASQQEHRAALRWISGDSVQLLVQAAPEKRQREQQHKQNVKTDQDNTCADLLMLKEPHRHHQAEEKPAPPPMSAGDNNEQHRRRAEQRQQQQRDLLQLMRQRLAANALAAAQQANSAAELPTLQQLQQQRRRLLAAGQQQQQQQQSRSNATLATDAERPEMEQQQLSGGIATKGAEGPILSSPRQHQQRSTGDNFIGANYNTILAPGDGDQRHCSSSSLLITTREQQPFRTVKMEVAEQHQPVPRPRVASATTTIAATSMTTTRCAPIQDELSILTSPQHPRVREIANGHEQANQQSPGSVLSDTTTLITEAAMNSAELIPKLIERLDRKLVVMKDEQLSLMREIELNEATGQRLFAKMQRHLTASEFEKISLHANEIEKVTKLILSLKLRLKRVECELKERSTVNNNIILSPPPPPPPTTTTSQQQQQQEETSLMKTAPPQTTTRGVSDPTSTIGLPKRNHQHHASLQLPHQHQHQQTTKHHNKLMLGARQSQQSLTSSSSSSPISSPRGGHLATGSILTNNSHQQQLQLHREEEQQSERSQEVGQDGDDTKTASTSSDSIFNCADSAIGSTITGHGGSATNIIMAEEPACVEGAKPESSNTSQSPPSSTHSSLVSSASSSARQQLSSPGSSSSQHLSSSMSVASSQSSMSSSSVPHSPPLASPANNRQPQKTRPVDSINNGARCGQVMSSGEAQDSMVHLLSDIDILIAKRNKLISQLEEAHQLEECIVHRNNIIIQRILKKYFKETNDGDKAMAAGNEIEDFKQFTRLKSLLLKDTHDIADRIDNAELQLTELKQTNPQ